MTFQSLRREWYQKLKDSGFNDIEIEDSPKELLQSWHSIDFNKPGAIKRKVKRDPYQNKIDAFANSPEFPEIMKLFVKHGNSRFTEEQVTKIWDFHRDGRPERAIAGEMGVSKTCIHLILRKIREWMNLTI